MRLVRGMYQDGEPVLVPDGRDLSAAITEGEFRLPRDIYQSKQTGGATARLLPPDHIKPNAFCVHEDGRLCLNEDGVLRPTDDVPVRDSFTQFAGLIDVRDAVPGLPRSQLDGRSRDMSRPAGSLSTEPGL